MLRKKSDKTSVRSEWVRRIGAWFHGVSAQSLLIMAVGGLVLFMLFSVVCMSQRYHLNVGDIAHETIVATKDVEDTVTTEARRFAAEQSVDTVYLIDEAVNAQILTELDALFTELSMVQEYGRGLREEKITAGTSAASFSNDEVAHAQSLLTNSKLSSAYQTRLMLRTEGENFDIMCYEVRHAVERALERQITADNKDEIIQSIYTQCQYRVDDYLRSNIVRPVLEECIQINVVADVEATNAQKQAQRDTIESVIVKQGDNIVTAGSKVTLNQIRMLEKLGLLDDSTYDFSSFAGALLLILCAMVMLGLLLKLFTPHILGEPRSVLVIMLVLIISEALSVICVKLINVYLSPIALSAILLTSLLGPRVGVTGGLTITVIIASLAAASSGAFSAEMVNLMLCGIVGTAVSVQFLTAKPQRVRVVICGVIVAVASLIIMLAVGLMTASDLHNTMGSAVWVMAGGILSGLIALGFQPVFEAAFNLATPSKLLELANPNQPLLRRLLMEAPGTYHHSIIVANLAEAAAEKIGANPLLARTGAYFHDIGKLKRPMYFKENQRGENPHDHTDAYVSAAIVTAHTRDGLELAQRHHLPPEVQRIIYEHHGDTPVMYFYHKALQQADGKPVDVKDFRYNGSRPVSKESAIVMLADTIEAAVRSMADPTPESIQRFIERLVRGKIEDGQLSSSPLSLHDIDGICEAFSKVLSGVFHERIEYPTVQMNAAGEAVASAPAAPAAEAKTVTPPAPADAMPEPYNAPLRDDELPKADAVKAEDAKGEAE
ncbi:MAG: HDIG domain-containing protein [Clostridia bacterium]|nr:HDIG domain-containing protein [Clostridia bacterium]